MEGRLAEDVGTRTSGNGRSYRSISLLAFTWGVEVQLLQARLQLEDGERVAVTPRHHEDRFRTTLGRAAVNLSRGGEIPHGIKSFGTPRRSLGRILYAGRVKCPLIYAVRREWESVATFSCIQFRLAIASGGLAGAGGSVPPRSHLVLASQDREQMILTLSRPERSIALGAWMDRLVCAPPSSPELPLATSIYRPSG